MDNLKLNIKDLVKIKSDKVSIDEKLEIIKCSRTYITALPYDLRATSWDKLSERFLACKEEVLKREDRIRTLDKYLGMNITEADEILNEIESVSNLFVDMKHKQQAFEEADKRVLEHKDNYWRSFITQARWVKDQLYLDKDIYDKIEELSSEYFEKVQTTSYLTPSEQKRFSDLAKEVRDYKDEWYSDEIEHDDGEVAELLDDISSDLEILGSNDYFNQSLPQLHSDYVLSSAQYKNANSVKDLEKKYQTSMNTIESLRKDLDRNIMEATDLHDEALRTGSRMGELGLLDDIDHQRIIDEYRYGE